MPSRYFDKPKNYKMRFLKTSGFLLMSFAFIIMMYIFFPLVSWQIFLSNKFPLSNNQNSTSATINETPLLNLFAGFKSVITGTDFNNAKNWFPKVTIPKTKSASFTLSITKLGINNALVSSSDMNLDKHLVNFTSNFLPSPNSNLVILGLSSFPTFFKNGDYKTIFSKIYTLNVGDEIILNSNGQEYKYTVENTTMIDPKDFSFLDPYNTYGNLTLVTLTPPGSVWKRLVITAKIE